MKNKIIVICLFLCCMYMNLHAEPQYFDVLFGVGSIETNKTPAGTVTETIFNLYGVDNQVYLKKTEQPNGKKEFTLSCVEQTEEYTPVKLKISFDGKAQEFKDEKTKYSSLFNYGTFILSDAIIGQFLSSNEITIEFAGSTHRYNKNDLVINTYDSKYTFNNPIDKIKQFLK